MPQSDSHKIDNAFSQLTKEEIQLVRRGSQIWEFDDQEPIVKEGTAAHSLFIIESGSVAVTKETHSGEYLQISILGPGALFGEISLFNNSRRSAGACSIGKSKVLELQYDVLENLAKQHPLMGLKIYRSLAIGLTEKVNRTSQDLVDEITQLLSQTAEKARMEKELDTARRVQATLFPHSHFKEGGVEVAGFYEPASECGGDWWYYCEIKNKIYLWIGDATGHGVSAALITSAVRSAAFFLERNELERPSEALEILNDTIYEVSKGEIMMTFFIASFDKTTRRFCFANASHEPPFVLRRERPTDPQGEIVLVQGTNNPRLGEKKGFKFSESEFDLKEDDLLFVYTDGLIDLKSPTGPVLGERRVGKLLTKVAIAGITPKAALAAFNIELLLFRGGEKLKDDLTFFFFKG